MKYFSFPEIVTVNQISSILNQVKHQLGKYDSNITFDLSEIKIVDSAAIALLAHLKSLYKAAKFDNPTIKVSKLCQLYKIQL